MPSGYPAAANFGQAPLLSNTNLGPVQVCKNGLVRHSY